MSLLYRSLLSLILLTSFICPSIAQRNLVIAGPLSTTPGTLNTLVGDGAGSPQMTATRNVFVGRNAGRNTTIGESNVYVGNAAGYSGSGISARQSVMIGDSAGYNATYGHNVFLGFESGMQTTIGCCNTFAGYQSGRSNTAGKGNTFTGWGAGFENRQGVYNSYYGYQSSSGNIKGNFNATFGSFAGAGFTGDHSVIIGENACAENSGGNENVIVGDSAGYQNRAPNNVFIGGRSGFWNSEGAQNTLIGYQAGYNLTSSSNTLVGYQAGRNVTTGSNNIIIGPLSGTAITDGSDNVLLGYNSQAEDGLHNATAIGSGSRVAISNALILGNGANVGIGTSAPATRLEVVSIQADQSGLRLTSLTTNSPSALATDQFLTVNEQGDVVKARYQLRISDVSQWSDKVFSPTYQLRPLSQVATYVRQQGHLLGVPSAEEVRREGVDLVKINSLLLEKVEELTLYGIEQQKQIEKQQSDIDELKRLVKQLTTK